MPIFEYACDHCGENFEELVFGSSPEVICPKCKNKDVKKLISTFSFKSEGSFSSSVGSAGCGSCSSTNCGSCH